MQIPVEFQELSDKYDKNNHLIMSCGNYEQDSLTIRSVLDKNIPSENVSVVLFAPNKMNSYHDYLYKMVTEYNLKEYEIFYIEEITELFPELQNVDITQDHKIAFTLSNYILTTISLCIARAESIGSENLWIPYSGSDLSHITSDVGQYIKAINKLANIGTLANHNISLHFPILENGEAISNDKIISPQLKVDSALIMYSGGLDCTAAAYIMKKMSKSLHLFNIQYGQSNRNQEEYCIKQTVNILNREEEATTYKKINFSCISKIGGSALLKDDVKIVEENSKLEYVPFRNTILINLGIIYALKHNIKYLVTGGHHDDTLSPDNNLPYFYAFQEVLDLQYCSKELELYPVLLYLGGKSELIYVANELGVDFRYAWSCQDYVLESDVGIDCKGCGTCSNCSTRYYAFKRVGLIDPIGYKVIPHVREKWSGWFSESDEILEELCIKKKEFQEQKLEHKSEIPTT
ncbi:7-cyano-7-deazaguanine synthase [Bacillus cereus]|uniref:7-cyano-7-deazaguanine synthase n=1 Tax=Bacillus cereus TaxID=1396 RepID=UPI00397F5BEC